MRPIQREQMALAGALRALAQALEALARALKALAQASPWLRPGMPPAPDRAAAGEQTLVEKNVSYGISF